MRREAGWKRWGPARAARISGAALLSMTVALGATSCGDSASPPRSGVDPGNDEVGSPSPWPMKVDNRVQLAPPCTGPSLTFFQGETPIDVPAGTPELIDVPWLFGAYQIGFQVNGWYWRCAGGAPCPNPEGCRNPDNAGHVAILITPASAPPGCTAAHLSTNDFTCDASVPNASDVVTVTLEDPDTCLVRVEASGLRSLDPTAGCCDCTTCAAAPPGQQTHCSR